MGKLEGKIAIVTGAGRGIGRGIAEKLAAEGATVAVTDVNEATAKETAEAIGGVGIACDVTSREDVAAMVAEVRRRFGRVDVLVNNAGWDKVGRSSTPTPPTGTASSRSTSTACCTPARRCCRSWPGRAAARW
jgi:NAD(P)-dependent dehydrogenase (short-subunit alcohol dehydrogenase family)